MLFSLSLKNLKKSIRDYSIYFFTLILGVCIFYVFNAIHTQSAMMEVSKTKSEMIDTMIRALSAMSVVVSCVLGFLIVYASRFLIRKRKKEFAVYITLGMRKGEIARLLLAETAVIGLFSLGAGLVLGIVLSQFMSLLVANIFQADMSRFVFVVSGEAVVKTACYYVIIYVVVIVMNTIVVIRSKLIDLLVANQKKEKLRLKNPFLCVLVFAAACLMLGYAYYNVTANQEAMATEADVLLQIVLGIAGTFLVFWSVAGFVLNLVKKLPGVYYRGMNSFVLSEAGSQVNTSAAAGTVICLLLFATICILSSAFALKGYKEGQLDRQAPVDVCMNTNVMYGQPVRDRLEECGFAAEALDLKAEFLTYRADTVTRRSVMGSYAEEYIKNDPTMEPWLNEELEMVRESDYNDLARAYGFDPVSLGQNEYLVSADYETTVQQFTEGLKANDTIEVCRRTLTLADQKVQDGYLVMSYSPMNMGVVIVPDDIPFTEENEWSSYLAADYTEEYDTKEFRAYMDDGGFDELVNPQGVMEDDAVFLTTRSKISDDSIGSSGMVVFIALYLGFVFVISGAATLALKEMSDIIDSREKYEVLRQLGAGEKVRNRALLAQMSLFFGLPLLLAVIHSIFGIQVCRTMLNIYHSDRIFSSLIVTAVLIVGLYGGYFLVSYLFCRRVIRE